MRAVAAFMTGLFYVSSALASNSGATTQAEANRTEGSKESIHDLSERHVVLMPVVGIWNHPFAQTGWTAKPGPIWGLDVKIEPYRWLIIRASMLRGNQPVELGSGQMSAEAVVHQPILEITRLGLRVEPTLQLARNFSGYLGLGAGWGRVVAPEAVATPRLHTYDRSAVYLAYEGAIGIAYEPRANWIVLDFSMAASMLTRQTGSAYESVQAFTDSGHRTTLGGLSRFDAAYRAMFGVGFIL